MSGLEVERIQERVQGMTQDQQRAIVEVLPDQILWEAVYGRFLYLRGQTTVISQAVNN